MTDLKFDKNEPSRDADYFALSRQIAYEGAIGRQRKAFCIEYIKRKQRMFAEMQKIQAENTTAIGETISCAKGCSHCCLEYVETTIQEGEAIVYFLYQHADILDRFVKAYPAWKQRVRHSGDFFREAPKLVDVGIASKIMTVELQKGTGRIDEYAGNKIPCPFLFDEACLIYEVRPLTCAGLIATTPQEWCDPAAANKDQRRYQTARGKDLYDLSFYHNNLAQPAQAFMPVMVYHLLKYGLLAQIGQIPDREGLVAEYTNDAAVHAIIQKFVQTQ